ncbi:prenyltransferase/squalene oxidase repeat-containing protein [Methanohalophilus sp.]|uniref:prenyltransferase/squalene oxidase repeat-containing protein n=1 Tax=Methanohalophilus sp. TaxID=1966352 RepID=UPI002607F01D|nr:prenyltransferase/squalene oxidase repeat-containing protein [Methanohalophilus sp.]MDK2892350.1 hypothetical protein [Methanohalophilus sp.]
MTSGIKVAVDRGFFWLDQQQPAELKEISRFYLVYNLWNRDEHRTNCLKESLQDIQSYSIRDISRAISSGIVERQNLSDLVLQIKEQQNQDGYWGNKDIYDTIYSLTALANIGHYNPTGCNWILNNFSSEWKYPGTVSLIITALIKQGKAGNTDIYDTFINREVQWLLDNKTSEGGWKYIATTTIVIDALIDAGHPDAVNDATKWLLSTQNSDGSWGKGEKKNNTTAMVLACFSRLTEFSEEQFL